MDLLKLVKTGDLVGLTKRQAATIMTQHALHHKYLTNAGTARTAQDVVNYAESIRVSKNFGAAIHALTLSIVMKEAPGEAQEIFKAAA